MTWWWWHLPKEGETVPDYPPLDVTGRVAATEQDLPCGKPCVHTPFGPCGEFCVMDWANGAAPSTSEATR